MWQQYLYFDGDGSHSYFVYTPAPDWMTLPVPLVVMLHGCRQTAEEFAIAIPLAVVQRGQVLIIIAVNGDRK